MGKLWVLGDPDGMIVLGLGGVCMMDGLMGAGTRPCELSGKIRIKTSGLDEAVTELSLGYGKSSLIKRR